MITIENTDVWVLKSKGNGACFEMIHKPTMESKFCQYGEDASIFNDEYEAIQKAYANPESAWHRQSWNDCLAYLWDCLA